MLWRSVLVRDEIFGSSEEIIEDILFFLEHSRLVPGFAVLASAAQVWLRVEAALLHPPRKLRIPVGCHGNEESTISEHQRGCLAIALQPFFRRDEHWHARSIFRVVEDLLYLEFIGVERNFWFCEYFSFSGADVVVVHRRRNVERLECVEAVVGVLASVDFGRRSQSGI